jgi:DNA topoisomerase-1
MPPKKYYAKKAVTKIAIQQFIGAKYLVIVESPSKCSKIEGYLGDEYRCIASKGHIREIDGLKNIDTKNEFQLTFTLVKEKEAHVNQMRDIIRQFDKSNVILATDDDREGEAIAWHICQVFGLEASSTQRIVFNEITKPAIQAAILKPGRINMNLVYAQQARQALDIIVGFKISPVLWKKIYHSKSKSLSAGRCQTPALRLVYDNAKELETSALEYRYKTTGWFNGSAFDLNREFETTDLARTFLEQSKTYLHVLTIEEPRLKRASPPKPFNTSRLLQVASSVLKCSPKQTMQLCQSLYQNGHITYMRTDSVKYSGVFLEQLDKFVTAEFGDKSYVGNLGSIEQTDATNPHEAIRVTDLELRSLPDESKEAAMYRLIWRNTVESCMSDAVYNSHLAKISAPDKFFYQTTLDIPVFLGWKKLFDKPNDEDNPNSTLLFLRTFAGKLVKYEYVESSVVVRNKHSHYTEASLIQKLEDLGIGRPSTFATLVDTIQDRGYVKCSDVKGVSLKCDNFKLRSNILESIQVEKVFGQEKNKIVIQPLGTLCVEFLIQYFQDLFDYSYTKNMELDLDKIAHFDKSAESEWHKLCARCYLDIKRLVGECEKEKEVYKIDELHELVFQQYGPVIRSKTEDKRSYQYYSVKPDITVDLERAKTGGYQLSDLIAISNENLGSHEGSNVTLRLGKFGPYVEWNDQKISIRTVEKSLDLIVLEDVVHLLEPKVILRHVKPKGHVRDLTEDMSIRTGKFGPYVYYKTPKMKNPEFFNLKKFKESPEMCPAETLVAWIEATYLSSDTRSKKK